MEREFVDFVKILYKLPQCAAAGTEYSYSINSALAIAKYALYFMPMNTRFLALDSPPFLPCSAGGRTLPPWLAGERRGETKAGTRGGAVDHN
jgi:hypothetical protein